MVVEVKTKRKNTWKGGKKWISQMKTVWINVEEDAVKNKQQW